MLTNEIPHSSNKLFLFFLLLIYVDICKKIWKSWLPLIQFMGRNYSKMHIICFSQQGAMFLPAPLAEFTQSHMGLVLMKFTTTLR